MQVGMEDAITLDRKSFEALAADSRVRIMKSLAHRRKTLSELSEEIGLSNSTMKEHLDVLVSAGLAVQMDEGRKWKYYELTKKGKGIFAPAHREVKVLIMLAASVLLVLASFWNFASAFTEYSAPAFEGDFAQGEGVPFPMLGGAAPPEEAMASKAALPEGGLLSEGAPSEEEGLAMEGAGLEESASAMAYDAAGEASAYGENAPAHDQEREFPLLEAVIVLGSAVVFAFALYYAKKNQ